MIRLIATAAAAASVAVSGVAYATSGYDGPPRWETAAVTIAPELEDAAASWGDAVRLEVVPADRAQITTVPESLEAGAVGAEARSTFGQGNYLERCEIHLPPGDVDETILTHELGHCLGLGHRSGLGESNMHWFAKDYQGGWSDAVTDADRARLAARYAD